MPQLRALKPKQLLHEAAQEEIKSFIIEHSLKAGNPLRLRMSSHGSCTSAAILFVKR